MDEVMFWKIIDAARSGASGDCGVVADGLVEDLSDRTVEEVVGFSVVFDQLMDRAYSWELWGAAYVINGGCSDDGFEYFRAWLVVQGQAVFEAALANPESLVEVAQVDAECEDALYVAAQAYQHLTGSNELPRRYAPHPREPSGVEWTEDDLPARYPRLTAAFG